MVRMLRPVEYVVEVLRKACLERKSRMFRIVCETWNDCGKGCTHFCQYCNVWKRFIPKLQKNPKVKRYRDGFTVRFFKEGLNKNFKDFDKSRGLVFIWYMGDWMCPAVKDEWIISILDVVRRNPQAEFLSCTKNPPRYLELAEKYGWEIYPKNLWLGTTIESNLPIADKYTKAPPVKERYEAMRKLEWEKKFLSIEPKMDCEPYGFAKWVKDMRIRIVEVGADNYGNKLPEPKWWKVQSLLELLNETCDLVIAKEGLYRLKKQNQ